MIRVSLSELDVGANATKNAAPRLLRSIRFHFARDCVR